MNTYHFEAVRTDGSRVRGRLGARSGADATDVLTRRGLFPIAVTPATPETTREVRMPVRTQATVLRALASLVAAGVPVVHAMQAARRIVPGPLGEPLARAQERVREGAALAAAFEAEGLCSQVTIGLLRAGEAGAGLATALEQASVELELRADTRSRIRSALAYPTVLLVVGTVSVGAILLFVVPRFALLLADVQTTMPASTRLLLGFADLVRRHGALMATLVAGVVVAGGSWIVARRTQWHDLLLATPLVGSFRHALASVRGARALAALLERGAPTLTALSVARTAVGDEAVARRIAAASERVTQGASLSRALSAENAFTPLMLQLASIGDGVGRVPELLRRAADIEERLAEQRLRTFVALLEPALVVLFAVVVALVAAALLQAVYAVRPGAL